MGRQIDAGNVAAGLITQDFSGETDQLDGVGPISSAVTGFKTTVVSQPTFVSTNDMQNFKFAAGSSARTVAQRTSAGNRFYFYSGSPSSQQYHWTAEFPSYEFNDAEWEGHVDCYNTIVPNVQTWIGGSKKTDVDLSSQTPNLGITKGSFPGMTTNSTLKIRIYDDIPDEYNGGIKLISGKALIINPPSIAASGNNPSNLINNRLYFYASDSHTYSLTATFPAITSGSLHNVGRITIDGTNTDGSTNTINATIETSQISGNKITVNLDDGLPFGVGKTRSVASGKNLPYPNPSSDGIWARDAVVLSSPSISIASMTNYKGSKFWVYDNASYTYAGAFAINPAADNANEGDTWKGQSFVKTEGSNVSLSASDYSGTTCTFDFDKSHFSTEGVDTTLTFNDGTLLGSTKGEAAVTKSTKRINLPSILGSSVGGFSGGYQLWPDCPVSVLSGSAVLTTTYNSGSDYDAISLALNDGTAVGIASNNGAAATWNLTSVQVPLLEGATVTLNDNVLSTGGPTTSSTVSIGTLAMEDTPYVETLAIKTIGDANGKNLDFAGFQNRSLSGGRIVASSGLVIRSTYFAPMENMIVPCSKTDAHLSHVKINVLMTEGEGNDRILWDPVRRGYDEPNLWTAVGSADPMELGKQYTTRTGGYAININPGRMATMIFSQGGTKLKVVALDESSVATATHAPGVGYDATATASDGQQGDRTRNRAFWFWSNYLGQTQWEEFGRDSISSSSNSQSSSHSCIWTTIAQERSSNGSPGFWLTTRLMGWRVTAPHKAAKEGFGSAVEYHATGFDEACEQPYILLIPDNSPDWGMLNQQDAWGGGADACGDNGGGFIGMQTHHMSRITKVVNGVFPGVTYRMYISVAMRPPTGQDYSPDSAPNGSHGGPSGCRVHVVEPFLGDSSNDVVKKPLIAYGEFTCNHARSVDYNALNYKGGTGKVTDFCRTDPYEGNTSTGFASQSVENSDEKVNHQGFKLYYVEFTPTKGSTVVEINIEHAFVGNGLGNTVPSSWVKIPQQDFFSSSSTQEVERRDWHDYKGAWCSNDNPLNIDEGVNNDNTVFIGSVFIKMVRPCWVEKVKSKCFATQGGYDLSLSRSSSLNNAAGTVTLKSPDSAYQIIKTLAGAGGFQRTVPANLHDPLVSNAGPGTNGWFESSVEYDLDVISAHTHLYIWDPWAVDGEGRATANSCQAKVYSQTDGTAPTLHTNHYHGHSCFWEKKIWQLKSAHRGGGHNKESSPPQPWPTDPPNDTATSWIPKRPGYPRVGPGVTGRQYYSSITSEWKSTDNFWSWDKHYFAYMPTLATEYNERWTNITDWTGAQLWDDVRDNGGGLTSSPDADWWHTQFSNKDVLGVWHVTDSLRCVPFVEDSSADTDWGLGLPDFGEIDTWRYAGYNAPSLGHLRMSHIDPSGWVEFPLGFASSTSSYNTATSTALGGLLIAKPTAKNAYFRMKLASGNTIWDSDITSKFSSGGYFLVKPHYYPIFAKGVVNFHLFDPRTNTYVGEQPWFLPPPPYEPGWDEADDNNKIFAMSSKYRSGAQRNISPSSRGQSYGDIIRPAFKKDTRHLHGDYHVINHAGLAELYQRCTMHAEADFDSWVYKSPTAFVMSDALGDAGKLSQATTISG